MVKHFDIPQPIKRNGSRLSDVKEEGTARNRRAAGAAARRASRIPGFVRFAVVLTYDLARGGRNMPDETDFSDLDLSGFLDPVLATGGSHRGGRRNTQGAATRAGAAPGRARPADRPHQARDLRADRGRPIPAVPVTPLWPRAKAPSASAACPLLRCSRHRSKGGVRS